MPGTSCTRNIRKNNGIFRLCTTRENGKTIYSTLGFGYLSSVWGLNDRRWQQCGDQALIYDRLSDDGHLPEITFLIADAYPCSTPDYIDYPQGGAYKSWITEEKWFLNKLIVNYHKKLQKLWRKRKVIKRWDTLKIIWKTNRQMLYPTNWLLTQCITNLLENRKLESEDKKTWNTPRTHQTLIGRTK